MNTDRTQATSVGKDSGYGDPYRVSQLPYPSPDNTMPQYPASVQISFAQTQQQSAQDQTSSVGMNSNQGSNILQSQPSMPQGNPNIVPAESPPSQQITPRAGSLQQQSQPPALIHQLPGMNISSHGVHPSPGLPSQRPNVHGHVHGPQPAAGPLADNGFPGGPPPLRQQPQPGRILDHDIVNLPAHTQLYQQAPFLNAQGQRLAGIQGIHPPVAQAGSRST